MFAKRQRGYRSMGYEPGELPDKFEMLTEEWLGAVTEFDGDMDEDVELADLTELRKRSRYEAQSETIDIRIIARICCIFSHRLSGNYVGIA
jgi:predicted ArsR family transcriptional regulator